MTPGPVSEARAPRVFISYSHDSPEHQARVLALANRLREWGVDTTIDQYDPSPDEGWPQWMTEQVEAADYILLICTETYLRRVEHRERAGTGTGVKWEGNLIYNLLYTEATPSHKFVPVLLESGNAENIPLALRGHTFYRLNSEQAFEDLYRHLTRQEGQPKPSLGGMRVLPMPPLRSAGGQAATAPWRLPGKTSRAIAAVVLLAALGGGAWFGLRRGAPEAQPQVVAVRAFKNLSADPAQDYFSSGMTEEVQGQISKIASIRLLSRSAVGRYKDGELRRMASEIGAKHVVEGSVRADKERVRISVQLVDPATEQMVWSNQYDRRMEDLLAVQSEVAIQIVGALRAKLTADERKRIAMRPTSSAAAYDLYLQARGLNRFDRNASAKATSLLRQAVDIDPQFGEAMADIAYRLLLIPGKGNAEEGMRWAQRAVEAAPESAKAYSALGMALTMAGMTSKGRAAMLRASELDPNFTDGMTNLGLVTLDLGYFEEALHWARGSLERNPNGPVGYAIVAASLTALGDRENSFRWLEVWQKRFPKSYRIAMFRTLLEFQFGDMKKAAADARSLLAADPKNVELQHLAGDLALATGAPDAEELTRKVYGDELDPSFINWIIFSESARTRYAYFRLRAGDKEGARRLLAEAERVAMNKWTQGVETPLLPLELSVIGALQNQHKNAADWLQRAYERGWRISPSTRANPMLGSLRGEPWFQDLLRRMDEDVRQMRTQSAEIRVLFGRTVPALPVRERK